MQTVTSRYARHFLTRPAILSLCADGMRDADVIESMTATRTEGNSISNEMVAVVRTMRRVTVDTPLIGMTGRRVLAIHMTTDTNQIASINADHMHAAPAQVIVADEAVTDGFNEVRIRNLEALRVTGQAVTAAGEIILGFTAARRGDNYNGKTD